eukprot:20002_1
MDGVDHVISCRFSDDVFMAKLKRLKQSTHCAHKLYAQSHLFIQDILWTLHLHSFDDVHHSKHCTRLKIIFSNSFNSMCAHCITVLLATVNFVELMNDIYYCRHSKDIPKQVKWLNLRLMVELFYHPKMYKIMSLNICVFDRACHMVCAHFNDDLVQNAALMYPKQEKFYVFLRMIYLSIPRWDKRYLLHFISAYVCAFHYYWVLIYNSFKSKDPEGIEKIQNNCVMRSIFGEITYLLFKSKNKTLLNQIKDNSLVNLLKGHNNDINTAQYLEIRNNESQKKRVLFYGNVIKCSYEKCNKSESADEKFKICKGCKMTYYCCRQCQKKSWNTRHRIDCKQLLKYYTS